jgi:ornithine--oxo-acid transaminase
VYALGKALGGGIVPASAVVADWSVMGVFTPGSHGSTFAGNPLACAIGRTVIALLRSGEIQDRSRYLGERLHTGLATLIGHGVSEVRGRGLWAGLQIDPSVGTGRAVSEMLLRRRVLTKETHGQTLRISPPLVIEEADLDWALTEISEAISDSI